MVILCNITLFQRLIYALTEADIMIGKPEYKNLRWALILTIYSLPLYNVISGAM